MEGEKQKQPFGMKRDDFINLHGEDAWVGLVKPMYESNQGKQGEEITHEEFVHAKWIVPVLKTLHVGMYSLVDIKRKLNG